MHFINTRLPTCVSVVQPLEFAFSLIGVLIMTQWTVSTASRSRSNCFQSYPNFMAKIFHTSMRFRQHWSRFWVYAYSWAAFGWQQGVQTFKTNVKSQNLQNLSQTKKLTSGIILILLQIFNESAKIFLISNFHQWPFLENIFKYIVTFVIGTKHFVHFADVINLIWHPEEIFRSRIVRTGCEPSFVKN